MRDSHYHTEQCIWDQFLWSSQRDSELLQAETVSEFCTSKKIQRSFISEHASHFGGLWEAALKSIKAHLPEVDGETILTFEELMTMLMQIEACLNFRRLTQLQEASHGLHVLTPGHFFIGKPITSLPDQQDSYRSITLSHWWNLCQTLTQHFWYRWSSQYLNNHPRFSELQTRMCNLKIGDIGWVRNEHMVPTKWPLARLIQVHIGPDGKVRVVTLRIARGTYSRDQ